MIQALVFLAILSVVVVIHELGHLLAAKFFKVRVDEFGFGLPPKVFRLFRKGGTDYTINALPIGGFVKLYGENGEKDLEVADSQAFWYKKPWQRAIIVVAGVVMNFILAVVLFATVYSFLGIPTQLKGVKVVEIVPNSPVENVLKIGDEVVMIRAEGKEYVITENERFLKLIAENRGKEIELVLKSGGSVRVMPRLNPPEGEGSLGVVISDFEMKKYPWWQMPFRGVVVGLEEALIWGRDILAGFGELIYKIVTGRGIEKEALAGPIGIYQISNQAREAGILALFQFVGVLSVNLAILNILPFPALDGGRLLFLMIELVTGKKVKDTLEAWIHSAGMVILLTLMVLITANDILRLLGGWGGIIGKLGL